MRNVAEDHGGAPFQIVGRPGWQAGDGRSAAADKCSPCRLHQVGQRLSGWRVAGKPASGLRVERIPDEGDLDVTNQSYLGGLVAAAI